MHGPMNIKYICPWTTILQGNKRSLQLSTGTAAVCCWNLPLGSVIRSILVSLLCTHASVVCARRDSPTSFIAITNERVSVTFGVVHNTKNVWQWTEFWFMSVPYNIYCTWSSFELTCPQGLCTPYQSCWMSTEGHLHVYEGRSVLLVVNLNLPYFQLMKTVNEAVLTF